MSANKTVGILEDAIETIKQGWTQGANARDLDGNVVPPNDDSACRWCLMGAVYRSDGYASSSFDADAYVKLKTSLSVFSLLGRLLGDGENYLLSGWNDDVRRTREDVLVLLNKALEQEKSK